MNYDGLDFTTTGTIMPADMGSVTGAVTIDAGATVKNGLRQTVYCAALDVTPTTVVAVKRFRLVPGAANTLPTPQGVWLVAWDTTMRLEWAIGWCLTGQLALWGLAGWGAGDIAGRLWNRYARRGW